METATQTTTPRIHGTLHLKKKSTGNAPAPAAAAPAPASAPVVTPAPATAPAEAPKPATRPTATQELITLKRGTEFTVVFSLPHSVVPKEIQVNPAGGGYTAPSKSGVAENQAPRFADAKLDLSGLLSRCSIKGFSVRSNANDFCRVYVNCEVGTGELGFNVWAGGAYESFVRKNLNRVWHRAIIGQMNDHPSLELRKVMDEARRPETVLRFAIED